MGQLAKKGYDVSHSRPFKATPPGTRPNDKRRATKRKRVEYSSVMLAKASLRRARRALSQMKGQNQ